MATSGVLSTNLKVTRGLCGVVENAKVNGKLYLRQITGANESYMIEPNAVTALGENNWAIYDGAGTQANLVANGQGMYTYVVNWNQSFTLVFKDERFKESTLKVMGTSLDKENEWAIVGGTGEFAMARGIIKRRQMSVIDGILTQELTVEFFCRMHDVIPAPIMRGPWAANGGSLREMQGKSQCLQSVTINSTGCIDFMQFFYIDQDGQIRTPGVWGIQQPSFKSETINFGPSEWVKQICGQVTSAGYVQQLQIVTNRKTYGTFGYNTSQATGFNYTVLENETVVGFCAKIGNGGQVAAIGVYTI